MHRTAVKKVVRENVLDANDTLARANRDAVRQGRDVHDQHDELSGGGKDGAAGAHPGAVA